jgi:hypothetical protein
MLLGPDFDGFFVDAVDVLRPYLTDIVCLGGCANALYRFHRVAAGVPFGFVGTKDVDMGVPQRLPPDGRPPVAELMSNIGFRELTCGDADDAVIKYGPRHESSPVDLEFLCGKSGLSRTDQNRAALSVQEGLYAQPLRYLEMLMFNTWDVSLERVPGLERVHDVTVRVPNPAAYVVAKILIRRENRPLAAMQKDCFYIYEISVLFRDAMDSIRMEYDRLAPCAPKWKRRFAQDAQRLFSATTSEGPVSAVHVYRDLGASSQNTIEVTEEMVQRSVARLLSAMME